MKILFYLPVVTPWWFEMIITPMLRALYREAELHILVGPLWCNTGLESANLEPLSDMTNLNWHIVDVDEPALFRLDGAAVSGLLDLVHSIAPDITLARCAEMATLDQFPGTVRYLMEGTADPFKTPMGWIVLEERLFAHGTMPEGATEMAARCAQTMCEDWAAILARNEAPGPSRALLGLPEQRPILAVPLQYEHPENFFAHGSPFADGPSLLLKLMEMLDPEILLAVTDHPLNEAHLRRNDLAQVVAEHADRISLMTHDNAKGMATSQLSRAADAMLIDRSKCVAKAAFFGTPVIQTGDNVMADWLRASPLGAIDAQRLTGRACPAPDMHAARRWFGWHFGMRLFKPATLTLDRLLGYVARNPTEPTVASALEAVQPWFKAAA